ncbi:putative acetyl xylan esterase [Actinacidiphila reveromycinica]|uniref:Putative acetyl xylan esterase n=1 Tax=Actinacidiphila reveromycinica TaxID=659352 RepID=A0A7U3VLS5_9ACTN|nr:acetylxylan esterase [Streptomyces sp. SN-593]BBA95854.1 putative acetyl xylan esterase [Streptomyces sp. SN-593]
MAQFDMPIEQLRTYRSESVEPPDFDRFWADTLAQARGHDLAARFEPVATALRTVDTFDVEFSGFDGHRIKGWFTVPAGAREPLPVVVEFIGYGGGRGLPHERLTWASAGYAHFLMDTRGQGGSWSTGDTPDPVGSGSATPGFLTRGITDRDEFYYRRVITDGVRAVEAARTHPLADASRTVVTGVSQGGGLSIAVGGLVPDLVAVAPDVPFLCDLPRAVRITDAFPYREVASYLSTHRPERERAFGTLAYFDNVHFAARGRAPALFSTALLDATCPPSTVFAAFNGYGHEDRTIEVYDFNGHEGGGAHHEALRLEWLPKYL